MEARSHHRRMAGLGGQRWLRPAIREDSVGMNEAGIVRWSGVQAPGTYQCSCTSMRPLWRRYAPERCGGESGFGIGTSSSTYSL